MAALGLLAVSRFPHLIVAYIGVSQLVALRENDEVCRRKLQEAARQAGNRRALRELSGVRLPLSRLGDMLTVQHWLRRFRGDYADGRGPGRYIWKNVFSPEYSLLDVVRFFAGLYFSERALRSQLLPVDLRRDISGLTVPVYFLQGRHDLITPPELAETFSRRLQATQKEFIWFEHSAHSPHLEESGRFQQVAAEKFGRSGA